MTEIARTDFIRLTGLTRVRFDARARSDRGQFPFLNTDLVEVTTSGGEAESKYRSYRAIDALMTIVSDDLSQRFGMPYNEASWLACQLYDPIRTDWRRISASSAGETSDEIVCGGIQFVDREAHRKERWVARCGTVRDILDSISNQGPVEGMALVSVTRAAMLMRSRAEASPAEKLPKIDLSEFWRPDRYSQTKNEASGD